MRELTLGYSPCPNDTFIFHSLVHGKLNSGDLIVKERLEDVETLNMMARRGELDITKVSFSAFAWLREEYVMLRSGGALGRGCGPLIVAREKLDTDTLKGRKIAIPGLNTKPTIQTKMIKPRPASSQWLNLLPRINSFSSLFSRSSVVIVPSFLFHVIIPMKLYALQGIRKRGNKSIIF